MVPIGWAARIFRIPYMTHDSDPIPGLANRLIAKGAKKNAVVSNAVKAYPADKTIVTGIPLQREFSERRGSDQAIYKEKLGFPKDCVLLFVFAGTQGAKKIDDALEVELPSLLAKYPKLHVAYIFGRLNEASISTRYKALDLQLSSRLQCMTFIENAYDYIAAADIIVGRAGATSLAEFATIGRACIIVPAEQLTGGHQLMNVEQLEKNDAAIIVYEKELSDRLNREICGLIESPRRRSELARKILDLAPVDAARSIAHELRLLAGKDSAGK